MFIVASAAQGFIGKKDDMYDVTQYTRTALTFAGLDSHSNWHAPLITAIAYAYMKLPAVIVPLEQSLPPLRPTNAVFVPNDPRRIIEGLQ